MIKKLSNAVGISGNEGNIMDIITAALDDKNFFIKKDSIGNLIVETNNNPDKPTVLIYSHMDEPGIIITDITEDGYLKFETIGEIDVSSLVSQHIKIGDISGIISLKAVHLTTKEERERPVKTSDLFIDIGASTKEEAEKIILPGDYGSFDTEYKAINGYIKGKALSSRIGCFVLLDILLNSDKYDVNLVGIFTVQKEISARGATVSSYSIPDCKCIILLDAEDATEYDSSKVKLDMGVTVCRYNNISEKTLHILSKTEKKATNTNILYQKSVLDKHNETFSLLSKKTNLSIIPLNIPCKFIHTSVNVVSRKDIQSMSDMIDIILKEV